MVCAGPLPGRPFARRHARGAVRARAVLGAAVDAVPALRHRRAVCPPVLEVVCVSSVPPWLVVVVYLALGASTSRSTCRVEFNTRSTVQHWLRHCGRYNIFLSKYNTENITWPRASQAVGRQHTSSSAHKTPPNSLAPACQPGYSSLSEAADEMHTHCPPPPSWNDHRHAIHRASGTSANA